MINHRKKFILVISVLLISGFFISSFTSYYVSRSSLRFKIETSELPLTSDNIYSEIQRDLIRPIFISSLMASDTFLRDWIVDGEKNDTKIVKYLKEIRNKYNTVTSFLISDLTLNYYHYDGILKKVSANNYRDKWYFRVKKMTSDYETNVDLDMGNDDTITIFVNHKVFDYKGKYIGATGIGLTVNSFKELIKKYQKKYKRHVYFTDKKGEILILAKGGEKKRQNIKTMEGISLVADEILSRKQKTSRFQRKGAIVHLNSRFIPELAWYLLVEETEGCSTKEIYKTLILNLLLCTLVTIIVALLINFTLNAYKVKLVYLEDEDLKLRKINTNQEAKIHIQNKELMEKNSKLEDALEEVNKLSGFLPICASCKKIRDDKGSWNQIETYITAHSEAEFSHSICPECAKTFYPDFTAKGL